MAHAISELLWIEYLLKELGISFTQPTLYYDNLSAVSLAHNPVLHSRTKHMEMDIHFVRDKVIAQTLKVLHIPTADQLADILTKPIFSTQFPVIRTKLNVCSFGSPH